MLVWLSKIRNASKVVYARENGMEWRAWTILTLGCRVYFRFVRVTEGWQLWA